MLRVVFKNLPFRDCLQYITKQEILLSHFLLRMARNTYAIVTDLGLYPIQQLPSSIMIHTCPVKCTFAMIYRELETGKQETDGVFCQQPTSRPVNIGFEF